MTHGLYRTQMYRAGHDWLVDMQPTSITYSNTGMVLGRNIARRIEVSLQLETEELP